MSKKANGGEPMKDQPAKDEASPPILSEKLITQLQSAVRAARQRRFSNNEPSHIADHLKS
jgi:hypothetical protein